MKAERAEAAHSGEEEDLRAASQQLKGSKKDGGKLFVGPVAIGHGVVVLN